MGKRKLSYGLWALVLFFVTAVAQAAPPTHGAEFEITTPELNKTLKEGLAGKQKFDGREREFRDKYKEQVAKACVKLGCTMETVKGKWDREGVPDYLVTFKNGWWFKISYDPWVIEIQTKPSTIQELREIKPLADEAIFGTAKAMKYIVDTPSNNGHLNMGAKSAFEGPKGGQDFLRYFVDYQNHPELSLGILGTNLENAAPLSYLGEKPNEALKAAIKKVGRSRSLQGSIRDVATLLQSNVYTEQYKPEFGAPWHYQAIGMKHLTGGMGFLYDDRPFELRAVRGQRSIDEFILLAEMNELRVKYLADKKPPIVFHSFDKRGYSDSELASRFYVYIVEAGGDWEKFKKILPPNLQRANIDAFLREGLQSWGKNNQVAAMRSHLPYFATSEWLRERIVAGMKKSGAVGPAGLDYMNILIEKMKKAGSKEEKKIYEDAIREIAHSPTWEKGPEKAYERWGVKAQPNWKEARRLFPPVWQALIPKMPFFHWCAMGFRNFFMR